jgi:ribose-phosphate pyrophosphokinase
VNELENSNAILLTGTSNPALAEEISLHLGIPLGHMKLESFPDGEISLRIGESVRGRDVFVIQTTALKPNEYLMELLIIIDALKRASAKSIVAVVPYYGYCRQDRKDQPRAPITAKLVADLLEKAGITRILTMDLHAAQVQGFFNVPVDDLFGRPSLVEALRKKLGTDNLVVVAPDIGSIKLARAYATHLNVEMAIVDKRRMSAKNVEVVTVIGNVEGKNVLLADDMCTTAGTLVSAAKACRGKGANRIFAAVTHGVFVDNAVQKVETSEIEELFMSNTIPVTERLDGSTKIKSVSIAAPFAKAISCIIKQESISSLYTIENSYV